MTAKSSILTDREKAVVPTITRRLNLREALEYLKITGFELSERTYFRYKKKVESMKWQRFMQPICSQNSIYNDWINSNW